MGSLYNVYVHGQNALVGRVAFLVGLCQYMGIHFTIEQPRSSIMWSHPLLESVLQRMATYTAYVDLGAFGLESQKASKQCW
jgi:hypothetical protein